MKRTVIAVIVVVIAVIVLARLTQSFIRARSTSASNACINNLRVIDAAKQQWALELNQSSNAIPTFHDLAPWLGNAFPEAMKDTNGAYHYTGPKCPKGGTYTIGRVAEAPTCTVPGHEMPR